MSEHSAHLILLPFGFRIWLWRYTCLLLLNTMLCHRQAIFECKGDKLSSSSECRYQTWKTQGTYSSADWMPTHKATEPSRIKLKTSTQQPVPMMSEHSAQLTSVQFGFGFCDIHVCCCQFRCSGTGKRYSNVKATSYLSVLNSTARPYDEWAFGPLDFTAVWLSHLALAI